MPYPGSPIHSHQAGHRQLASMPHCQLQVTEGRKLAADSRARQEAGYSQGFKMLCSKTLQTPVLRECHEEGLGFV